MIFRSKERTCLCALALALACGVGFASGATAKVAEEKAETFEELSDKMLSNKQKAKAISMLKSKSQYQRKAAVDRFRQMEDLGKPLYAKCLLLAQKHHQTVLAVGFVQLQKEEKVAKPLREQFKQNVDALAASRLATLKFLRIDHKKAGDKIAKLNGMVADTERFFKNMQASLRQDASATITVVMDASEGLEQISRELTYCDPETYEQSFRSSSQLLDSEPLWKELGGIAGIVSRERELNDRYSEAMKHNKESGVWATPEHKLFAAMLNSRRFILGLTPLRLDEKLSLSCSRHSTEMQTMGYFSHTSPVEENKSPGKRAKNAGFEGGWSGENIFVGSLSHSSAFGAWWRSDGHRHIMFAGGPNTLGLGTAGKYWTLQTGRK